MNAGFLTTGLLTGLREGVEAALIVSIILAYLGRTGNQRHFGRIWVGTLAAVATSVAIGVLLFITIHELGSPGEQIFDGLAMLLAAGVVTWMLFWMRRTSANIRGELQAGIDSALTQGGLGALDARVRGRHPRGDRDQPLPARPGDRCRRCRDRRLQHPARGAHRPGHRAALGFGFYRGARVLNLPRFFRWTGVALVFIAAGPAEPAVHEFIEIGWIGVRDRDRIRHQRRPAAQR